MSALLPGVLVLAAAGGMTGCEKAAPPAVVAPTVITAIAIDTSAARPESGGGGASDAAGPARVTDQAFSGAVAARTDTELSFRVAGLMTSRPFQAGQRVARGAVLARLDDADARAQSDAADTAARTAADNLRIATIQRDRDQKQADAGLISAADRERSQQQFLSATGDNARAQQQRTSARNQLRYQQIIAEQDGVITDVRAEPGQTVAAGQAIYGFAIDGPRDFIAQVADTTVASLKVGMPATVVLNALPGRRLPVHVREIAAAANPRSQTYGIKLAFDRVDPAVLLGMSGTALLATSAQASGDGGPREARIAVPATALFHQRQSPAVWVVDPTAHTVTLRPVDVAQYGAHDVTLRGGLRAGEQVVARGVTVLSPGMTVTPHIDDGRAVLSVPIAPASAAETASAPTATSASAPASGAAR
ncbi:efflux RND transporter periplasmic adaptor subunit [Robbsia sp. KACC 23696]|uniref:efflux RND transporter periplasmic adaptor subunit n=1 Tax=Robbsia sp. KACC 23696 TaxID=3149231 RepID=UPI00325B52EF